MKDDYEYLKNILDEKINFETLLKAEIAQLKQVWPIISIVWDFNVFNDNESITLKSYIGIQFYGRKRHK